MIKDTIVIQTNKKSWAGSDFLDVPDKKIKKEPLQKKLKN